MKSTKMAMVKINLALRFIAFILAEKMVTKMFTRTIKNMCMCCKRMGTSNFEDLVGV